MKQESGKKSKLWLWLLLALVAVAAIVAAVLFLLPGGAPQEEAPGEETVQSDIYWNIDGAHYVEISDVDGMSAREIGEDGFYHIQFLVNGERKELLVADKRLVNYIDSMQLMGLVFDDNGNIIDALDIKDVADEVAKEFFVKKLEGGVLEINSSRAMNGMPLQVTMDENTFIYDMTGTDDELGKPGTPEQMDKVVIYRTKDGTKTFVYITERAPEMMDVYWRVERCWDATAGKSTRVPDKDGVYTLEFACEGKIVELKCKDAAVVGTIDSSAVLTGQFAFEFDEEGYIIGIVNVALATRSIYAAGDYHVTGIEGDTVTFTRLSTGTDQGKVVTLKLAEGCKIFQCCQYACYDENCGQRVESVQLGDRVNVYSNLNGEANLIFVTRRLYGGPMYYNFNRQYGGNMEVGTLRKKTGGYYVFEMLCEGKVVEVKVKDKKLADKMESIYNRCMGLEVNEKGVVTRLYDATCVYGGANLGTESYVTELTGPVIMIASSSSTATWNSMLSPTCKVYNVVQGEYGAKIGGELDLQLGDQITGYRNNESQLEIVFVMARPVNGGKVYYNLQRKYNTAEQTTTREPDEEGYYNFLLACDGKQVEAKTKSKGMASFIDSQLAPLVGLKVNKNGIITNAYVVTSVLKQQVKSCNYRYVENVKKSSFKTFYYPSATPDKKVVDDTTWTIAKNCKIYNVSTAVDSFRGEKSTLKNGDYIQAIRDLKTNEITQIWIMNRNPAYGVKNYKAHCDHCDKEVTWEPYVGRVVPGEKHYFLFDDMFYAQAVIGTKATDDATYDIVLDLKGKTLSGDGRCFLVYDHLTIMDTKGGGQLMGTNPHSSGSAHSGGCIMVAGGKLDILGGTLGQSEKSTAFGTMAGVLYVGAAGVEVNMYGGTLLGGTTTQNGGCVGIYGGIFNMYGGEIKGGTAPLGANIYASSGTINLQGGAVDGGVEMSASAKLQLAGKLTVTGTGIKIPTGKKLDLSKLDVESRIAVQATGIFTEAYDNIADYQAIFTPAVAEEKIILRDNALCYISSGPSDFVLDTDNDGMALCPACNVEVSWTPVTGRLGASMSGHYYVNADINDNSSQWATVTAKDAVLCVHLNGHTVTTSGRIATVGSGGTINLMGDGTIIGEGDYTGTDADAYTKATLLASTGPINLYDNVKVTTTAEGKPVMFNRVNSTISGNVVIEGSEDNLAIENEKNTLTISGGTFTGGILANGGTVQLGGNANVDVIGIAAVAKLKVLADFTGNANALFANPLVDGAVPEANGISTGEFTGKLYSLDLETGAPTQLFGKSGRLCTESADVTPPEPDFVLDPDGDNKAVCPVCGGAEVTWTPIEAGKRIGTGASGHFYLLESGVNNDSQYATTTAKEHTICLHLNGKDLTTAGRIAIVGSGGTINIMGEGSITSNATSAYSEATVVIGSSGNVTISDNVTITIAADGKPAVLVRNSASLTLNDNAKIVAKTGGVALEAAQGKVYLNDAAAVDNITVATGSKLTVNGNWTGSAKVTFAAALVEGVVPEANGASTGAFTGSLMMGEQKLVGSGGKLMLESAAPSEPVDPPTPPTPPAPEGELELDGNNQAECPVCKQVVTWTAVTASLGTNVVDGGHYYLTGDYDNSYQFMTVTAGKTVCFHNNGYTLTYPSRIFVTGATLNMMGGGSVISKTTTTDQLGAVVAAWANGVINIYGGNYATENDMPALKVHGDYSAAVNLYGDTVIESADIHKGTLTLHDNSRIGTLHVQATGKLVVAASWAGSAKVTFENALTEGVVPAANGASTGAFTGSLTMGEQKLMGQDGKLMVQTLNANVAKGNAVATAAAALDFTDYQTGTLIKCPVCEKDVTWEPINGMGKAVVDGGHYYVNKNITGDGIFLTVNGKTVCVHLNGKTLTYGARIFATSASTATPGTLNLMGSGTVSSSNSHADYGTGTIHAASSGIINLYGGTYKSTGANTKAVIHTTGGTVNIYSGATIDSNTGTNVLLEKGTVNLYGGTIKNGTGFLSGSNLLGGNVYLKTSGSAFNMIDGTITGGTATYGGNVRGESGTTFTMAGGQITGGNATGGAGNVNFNGTFTMTGGSLTGGVSGGMGGNIWSKSGTITIGEDATVSGGSAKEGGNIAITSDGTKVGTLNTCGTISGGTVVAGGGAPHGGNISGGSGTVINITGGQIYGGTAAGQAGNIRTYNGIINMTGGEIYGGTATTASNHNMWVAGASGVLNFTGGTIKGLDGTNASGTAINIGTGSTLNLGGTATAVRADGISKGLVYIYNGKLNVLNDWTGSASVKFASAYTAGTTIPATVAQCGAMVESVFTAGGSYAGALMNEMGDAVKILGVEGALVLDQLPAAE